MKALFLLAIFGSLGLSTMHAQDTEEYSEEYSDDDNDGYYDDGYYNDGIVWVGPGYYYNTWFNNENDYNGWRRNYYWRSGRRGYGGDGYYRGGRVGGGRVGVGGGRGGRR